MTEPADVPVVAEFVALEMAPVADRDALSRQLQPDEDGARRSTWR